MEILGISTRQQDKDTSIVLGEGLSGEILKTLERNHSGKKVAIITDTNLHEIYKGNFLRRFFVKKPLIIPLAPGEDSKTREAKARIEDIFLENNFGRDSLIIGFGGGIVCDLAGFIASTYARGTSLIHIPTSLLAMCDASIGGKTGVNTQKGKNLIGTFYSPDSIFIDTDFLDTLPEEEFRNGLAEIVKIAIVLDEKLFSFIEDNQKKIILRDKKVLLHLIRASVKLKILIVEKDFTERSGERQILNFGHTVGHALESLLSYRLKHGFCVSIGMCVESEIATFTKNLDKKDKERIVSLLLALGLPTRIDANIEIPKFISKMSLDKKSVLGTPRFVMPTGIGKVRNHKGSNSFEADKDIIARAIKMCQDD